MSDTFQQRPARVQVKQNCMDNLSKHLCNVGQPFKNKQSVAAAVVWFEEHGRYANTTPDNSLKSTSGDKKNTSDCKGLPSAEQLDYVYNKLGENLPILFKDNLDFSLYHPKLVFENNIRGTKTVGLHYFISMISILRLLGHLKYAFVKFDVLKITKHPEDGTIKVRWRIKGISGMKIFVNLWKFKLWNLEAAIKENVESWHDGFSIFYLGSDGLVHKLTADKMQPDNDPAIEEKNPLATKLALFLGLTPQLNNFDCLMTFSSEQTNELLKMMIMSIDVI